jgi:uncharacterized protein (TIGR02217 family)
MAFFEVEFPRQIGFTSTGGSAWNTNVNEGMSGFEQRNRNWAQSRAKWQILLNSKPEDYFQLVYNFFLNVGGRADGFRFLFPLDYKAAGQFIGTGGGSVTAFQLVKDYVSGSRTYTRKIFKPIMSTVQDFQGNFLPDTVVIYVNGVRKTLHVDYEVDATTGIVTFASAPSGTITADFQFHFPVRFDVDEMTNAQLEASDFADSDGLITWSQINIQEIRANTAADLN